MKHLKIYLVGLVAVAALGLSACGSYFDQTELELEVACAEHQGVRSAYAVRGHPDIAICMDGTLVSSGD